MPRQFISDSEWVVELVSYLNASVDSRINHVQSWLDCNLRRFEASHASIEDLRRIFEIMVIELRTNVQLCGAQCTSCNLLCIRSRLHEGEHNCNTNHRCAYSCGFCEDNPGLCGTRCVVLSLSVVVTEGAVAPGMLGSTCTWNEHSGNKCYFLNPTQLLCQGPPVCRTLQTIWKSGLPGSLFESWWRRFLR